MTPSDEKFQGVTSIRKTRKFLAARAGARCHIIAIAAAGVGLAGCSSLSPRPPNVQVELESTPPGADALTSLGQGCKTPCVVNVPIPEADFSVSFTLNDFQPVTIPVRVSGSPAGYFSPGTTRIEPNPVVAQLQPVAPPPKPVRSRVRPKKPSKPQDAAAAPPPSPVR
jgi:hypothetical protein